jgi:tetratricopeptide (TPR) repeat protein
MEILKRHLITLFCLVTLGAAAQNDASLQKAFSDSYTAEYGKRYTDAIAAINKVYDEGSYEMNLRIGWLSYLNKNYTQSQNYYTRAVGLKPYSVEARLGLVKPLSALESWDKVLATYEEILKIDPQNTTAAYWAGVIQYNRKKYDLGAKLFEKVVNMYPFDYDATHMLAWTYYYLGRGNDAKVLFHKALLMHPADASSIEGLSYIK